MKVHGEIEKKKNRCINASVDANRKELPKKKKTRLHCKAVCIKRERKKKERTAVVIPYSFFSTFFFFFLF